ncbi:MAG: LLM class F420-dependent oxidoreductase, partial [Gammaproteobacteria bacterium]|nr:LLM class F420-dependent oxidoreductase [Gammaproteobacteria bacterium]
MKFAYHATMCPPDQYLPLAIAAEEAGFDTFTFPDSICYPQEGSDVYPYNDDGTREFLDGVPFL